MADEQLYAKAVEEFKSGKREEALLAKAYALARGDEKAQEFEYIKLRVAQLRTQQLKDTARGVTSEWWPRIKKVVLWLFGLWVLALVLLGAFALVVKK